MKKTLPILIICLMLALTLVGGCSSNSTNTSDEDPQELADSFLDAGLNIMDSTVQDYNDTVAKATAEQKAELTEQGNSIMSSLDEAQNSLNESIGDGDDEASQEMRNKVDTKINELKAAVQSDLDTLAAK